MSQPEMLSTTNSAAAAGGGEGVSSSYGRGNCFPTFVVQQFPEYDPAR